nr:RDD family protein [Acanthopleuribacter pedis]
MRFLHAVVDTALWVVTFAMLKRWLIFTLLVQGIDPNPVVTVLYGMPLLTLALEMFLYYQFFEGFFGRTPAKFLTQTKVVLADGGRLTFTAALKRTLLRFVPFEALSFVASLTGWHDRGSGTRVINC